MQVPLKNTARSQILEKLASKIQGKVIGKVFPLLCFSLKLSIFLYINENLLPRFEELKSKTS